MRQNQARTRDKDAKIAGIIDATIALIEAKGYNGVTTREIARAAGVSNGLVFKYFPGGKPEIVKAIVLKKFILDIFNIYMPGATEFEDFPGYLRKALADSIAYAREHRQIYTAMTIASLSDSKFFEGLGDKVNIDEAAMQAFLGKFKGIHPDGHENPGEFIIQWLEVMNAMIMHHLFYPSAFTTDEKLVDMLVEISLRLWGFGPVKK